jgi:predicted extracellular nuclease
MYSGSGGEFIEFTNLSGAPVDLTGWSYDDDSRTPGVFPLSGVLAAGESLVITEDAAATFVAAWGLAGVQVLGEYTNNIGRNDEINLFDASSSVVDRLTYGDDDFPGTIRTQEASGNPLAGAEGQNDIFRWVLSSVGDAYGSWMSANGDVGNPGAYVPAPGVLAILGVAGGVGRRRR